MEWTFWVWYLWLLIAGFSLIAIMIRASAILRYEPQLNHAPIPVSVVIAARNEAPNLDRLVQAIMNQNHPDFELLIVLDRCSDDSLSIMKQLESRHANLRTIIVDYLPNHFSPKKFALTLGIKAARHECLLLTDADCLPVTDNWISNMSAAFTETTSFVLGFSPYQKTNGLLDKIIHYETFTTGFKYLSSAILSRPYMAVGRNIIVRKSHFLRINGYNKFQHIQGGDDDLLVHHHGTRQNTQVRWDIVSQTTSAPKSNWPAYYQQKIRHLSVGKHYRRGAKLSHSINWIVNLSLWVTFCILAISRPGFFPLYLGFFGFHLLKGLTYWMVKRKMDNGYSIWTFPILEFMHLILMPVFVIGARVTTKVKWK